MVAISVLLRFICIKGFIHLVNEMIITKKEPLSTDIGK
jgi:hypothetical protein